MISPEDNKALLRLGAGDWLPRDIICAYDATEFAKSLGDPVIIDSIYTARCLSKIILPNHVEVQSRLLDKPAALQLADIDLARYDLDDEHLSQRELTMKELLTEVHASRDVVRQGIANAYTQLGGVAVIAGTIDGINSAHRNFETLTMASHLGVLPPSA